MLAALTWRKLLQIDAESHAPTEALELLRAIPIFAPLPPPALERLASQLEPVEVSAGPGLPPGRRGRPLLRDRVGRGGGDRGRHATAELGPGDFFGEIALLRDVPRTASVKAIEPTAKLQALGRDAFLDAVTGHAPSARAADAVVGARLDAARVE